MMAQQTFYLCSLGCAKNTVDSHSMAALLQEDGFRPVEKPSRADVLIVNTCGFIQPARDESLSTLRELARKKRKGQLLIAAGCLTERYRQEIAHQVPGVDGILGTRRWMDILDVIHRLYANPRKPLYHLPDVPTIGTDEHGVLRAAVQGGSAYLKIADGCRRPCAFCTIPIIKGTAVSRPAETIYAEARILQDMGVQELILIAQDTTDYGYDLGMKDGLATLLTGLVKAAPNIPWIRLMYAYPGYVTDQLISVMADSKQILPYLDIPLQHAHPDTLRRMRRPANIAATRKMIDRMRRVMPDLAIRTTFIVGYPGEDEVEFQTLLDFISELRFDRVGVFPFSFEIGAPSESLDDPIPPEVKQERMDRLMSLQAQISLNRNQAFVGKQMDVLVEGMDNGLAIGRSYRDAPEIDGLVILEGEAPVGRIIPVQITGAMTYDLTAVPLG